MDYFSRRLDIQHYENAMKILANLTWRNPSFSDKTHVSTYELYDKAFTFPRVRLYDDTQ